MILPYSIRRRLLAWAEKVKAKREPDVFIGGRDDPYMLRWHIIRSPKWFNVFNLFLHEFRRSDDDRALHDHPWPNMSILLDGAYIEHLPGNRKEFRFPGDIIRRGPGSPHRIELLNLEPHSNATTTLFMTGRKVREWGFACPQGWIPWQEFTTGTNGERVGKGCE